MNSVLTKLYYYYFFGIMSTPEERLARSLRKDYRKTDFPTKRGGFLEPTLVMATAEKFAGAYIITTPSYSMSDIAKAMTELHVGKSTPREEDTYVPEFLKARGIVRAKEKVSSIPSKEVSCGVPGCTIRHPSHYCNVCDNWNVKHQQVDCPVYKCGR